MCWKQACSTLLKFFFVESHLITPWFMAGLHGISPPQGSMILCSQYLWESSTLILKLWGKLTKTPSSCRMEITSVLNILPLLSLESLNSSVIPGKQYDRSKSVSLLPNYSLIVHSLRVELFLFNPPGWSSPWGRERIRTCCGSWKSFSFAVI